MDGSPLKLDEKIDESPCRATSKLGVRLERLGQIDGRIRLPLGAAQSRQPQAKNFLPL